MAAPRWNRINFDPVAIPRNNAQQSRYQAEGVFGGINAGLQQFKDTIAEYGAIQDRNTNAELARRMMGVSDPEMLRQAITDGSLTAGLDPRSVTATAYTQANDQIRNLLGNEAQRLSNATSQFNLDKGNHDFDRTKRFNEYFDANPEVLQAVENLYSHGDVKGAGNFVAGLNLPEGIPVTEAMNMLLGGRQAGIKMHAEDRATDRANQLARIENAKLAAQQQQFAAQQAQMQAQQAQQAKSLDLARVLMNVPREMQEQILAETAQTDINTAVSASEFVKALSGGGGYIPDVDEEGNAIAAGGRRSSGAKNTRVSSGTPLADGLRPNNAIPGSINATPEQVSTSAALEAANRVGKDIMPIPDAYNKFTSATLNADQFAKEYVDANPDSGQTIPAVKKAYKELNDYLKETNSSHKLNEAQKMAILDKGWNANTDRYNPFTALLGIGDSSPQKFDIEAVKLDIDSMLTGKTASEKRVADNVSRARDVLAKQAAEYQKRVDRQNQLQAQLDQYGDSLPSDMRNSLINNLKKEYSELDKLNAQLGTGARELTRFGINRGYPDKPPAYQSLATQFVKDLSDARKKRDALLKTAATNDPNSKESKELAKVEAAIQRLTSRFAN